MAYVIDRNNEYYDIYNGIDLAHSPGSISVHTNSENHILKTVELTIILGCKILCYDQACI